MDRDTLKMLKDNGGRSFPKWEDFPGVNLYMDQVTELVNKYMEKIAPPGADAVITASMINNYVKSKLMPPPVKKRYSKLHLAYIIIICTLKQTFGVSSLEKILPDEMGEEDIKKFYDVFALSCEAAYSKALSDMEKLSDSCGDDTELFILRLMAEADVKKTIIESILVEKG